ncbi:MAG: zinc ribbon domain-containing protein [Candidatus Thorarchaeota archaeon]
MSDKSTCPSCNREIKSTSKFCKFCGITLKSCPSCNEINKAEDVFCASCGEDISKVDVPKSLRDESQDVAYATVIEEIEEERKPKLVIWPPQYAETRPYIQPKPTPQLFEDGTKYEPTTVQYQYSRVRAIGFLGGPLPTSNVLSVTVEVFGLALALIAAGIVIASIGLAFFEYLIFPIITGILGGAILLSAPFFGIYYVSSKWLYKAFQIKRPVKNSTIILNYSLGTVLFSIIGLIFIVPIVLGGALGITLAVLGGIVYLMGLIVVPLKAYLADLVYVKAAMKLRDKEEEDKVQEKTEIEETEKKKEAKTSKKKKK